MGGDQQNAVHFAHRVGSLDANALLFAVGRAIPPPAANQAEPRVVGPLRGLKHGVVGC